MVEAEVEVILENEPSPIFPVPKPISCRTPRMNNDMYVSSIIYKITQYYYCDNYLRIFTVALF